MPITELEGLRGTALLFLIGVAAAASVDGLWAGLLCAGLSYVSYLYFFLPPVRSFSVGRGSEGIFAGLVFLLAAVVVPHLFERQRALRLRAEQATATLAESEALARTSRELAELRARQQLVVADLGRFALTGAAVGKLLERALRDAVQTLDADRAVVLELSRSGEALVLRASHGWEGAPVGSGTVPVGASLAGLALMTGEPVVSDDVRADPRFEASPLLRETGAVSAVAVVIRGLPKPWGVLGVFSESPRRFSVDDVTFVRATANVLGSALERNAVEAAVRASKSRLQLALEAGHLGTWEHDLLTHRLSWSPAVEEAFGLEPGSFPGDEESFRLLVHPDDRDEVERALASAALAGDAPYDVEFRSVRPDGSIGWISWQGQVLRDHGGAPVCIVGLARDVTERRRREDLLALLAESSELLSGSLDYERSLGEVARLVVPRLADCCIVDIAEPDGRVEQIAVVHGDSAQERRILALEERYPTDASDRSYVGRLLATPSARLVQRVDEAFLADVARDTDHLRALRELGLRSALYAPLVARGRTLGMITLLTDRSGGTLGEEQLTIAADLARHAALAVDNGRLYEQRSHIARTLQRGLLPPALPHISGIELAARYRPHGAGLEVGGDFYDAFELGEDRYAIVIGDVCGKGPEAAAVTGLARHTIRAASLSEAEPLKVLARLNEAVHREYDGSTFCTVVLGTIELDPRLVRLRLASGGHPLPLVLRAGGAVEQIGAPGTLVGVFEDAVFQEVETTLEPGAALLLYTDGLADRLAQPLVPGEQQLRELLGECAGLDADRIAARIEDAVAVAAEGGSRDDIAFLVVRVA